MHRTNGLHTASYSSSSYSGSAGGGVGAAGARGGGGTPRNEGAGAAAGWGTEPSALFARASSSSCCFFASAWRSLQVSFFAPPPNWGFGACDSSCACACCAAKGFTSFLGCNLIGVYAVPTGPILSSSAGFVGTVDDGTGAGAAGVKRGAGAGCVGVSLRMRIIGM